MQPPDATTHGLSPLGVPEQEEDLYRLLLAHRPMSQGELARVSGLGRVQLREAVASLEAKGLVSRSAHRRPLVVASPPDPALETLIVQRARDIERARAAVGALVREFGSIADRVESTEIVQLVTGREAITRQASHLQLRATREVLVFDKPPYESGGGQNQVELRLLKRGIRYRVIYDRAALEWPGQIELLREIAEAGEEARMVESLPTGLAIADHNLAILPLRRAGTQRGPQRMLILRSPLLDALVALFELYWERATPIRFAGSELVTSQEGNATQSLSDSDRELLVLLAADLKDDAIARQLGIARRSVQRRIRRLAQQFGVNTRLQLVLYAVRNGLV